MVYVWSVDGNLASELIMNSGGSNDRSRLAKRARLQSDPDSERPVLLHQEAVIVLNHSGYEILRLEAVQLGSENTDVAALLYRQNSDYSDASIDP
jgi:hypothetical protein